MSPGPYLDFSSRQESPGESLTNHFSLDVAVLENSVSKYYNGQGRGVASVSTYRDYVVCPYWSEESLSVCFVAATNTANESHSQTLRASFPSSSCLQDSRCLIICASRYTNGKNTLATPWIIRRRTSKSDTKETYVNSFLQWWKEWCQSAQHP